MDKNATPLERDLWKNWIEHDDLQAANELIKQYMYLVTFHVERIATNLPKNVSHDDLMSLALMGLYDAIKKFEPKRGLKFDTYASFRIRGSIIDGLRKEDWLPRSHRERTKQIDAAAEQLEQKLKRSPTSKEIAHHLNISESEVESLVRDNLFSNILSIEDRIQDDDETYQEGIGYVISDEKAINPEEYLVNQERYEELAESIKQLNHNEQLVISLFYHDELTMTEIGDVLELTTSRISQIHRQALFKLRKILEELQNEQIKV